MCYLILCSPPLPVLLFLLIIMADSFDILFDNINSDADPAATLTPNTADAVPVPPSPPTVGTAHKRVRDALDPDLEVNNEDESEDINIDPSLRPVKKVRSNLLRYVPAVVARLDVPDRLVPQLEDFAIVSICS